MITHVTGDARAEVLRHHADLANRAYANHLLKMFATSMQGMFPQACTVSIHIDLDSACGDGRMDASLLLIRDQMGMVVWASDYAIDKTANQGASWVLHAHGQRRLELELQAALEHTVEGVYAADPDVLGPFAPDEALRLDGRTCHIDLTKARAYQGEDTTPNLHDHHADILEAIANSGGSLSTDALLEQFGMFADADLVPLAGQGQITRTDPIRITEAGWRRLARAHNAAAMFLPADPGNVAPDNPDGDGSTLPAIHCAGAQAYLYVDGNATLRLALHVDSGEEIPAWLRPGDHVPVVVTINGDTVYSSRETDHRQPAADGCATSYTVDWEHRGRYTATLTGSELAELLGVTAADVEQMVPNPATGLLPCEEIAESSLADTLGAIEGSAEERFFVRDRIEVTRNPATA